MARGRMGGGGLWRGKGDAERKNPPPPCYLNQWLSSPESRAGDARAGKDDGGRSHIIRAWGGGGNLEGMSRGCLALGLLSPPGAVGNKGHRAHGSWSEGRGAVAEREGLPPPQAETDTLAAPETLLEGSLNADLGDRRELPGRGVNSVD